MTDLPANVYRLPQRRFDAIPGAPWVYWVSDDIRALFTDVESLNVASKPWVGLQTSDNPRFLRFWWEVGHHQIGLQMPDESSALRSGKRWFPHMKGGEFLKWYGNQDFVVNWHGNGYEMKAYGELLKSKVKSPPGNGPLRQFPFYFKSGVTWTHTTAKGLNVRLMPEGFICNVEGMAAYPNEATISSILVLAVLNSSCAHHLIDMMNPTIHFGATEVGLLPFPKLALSSDASLSRWAGRAVAIRIIGATQSEMTLDFVSPPNWAKGLDDLAAAEAQLLKLERQIDDEVYHLYRVSEFDRSAIEAELPGGVGALDHEGGEGDEDTKPEEREEETTSGAMTREELAVRWISYAAGVVLGRFRPGVDGALGRAVYRRDDFAIGSLPAPDEAEFDELVGPVERFAYVDADGGRHVFTAEVEQALRDLALPDGIAVLDEGHPRDLPALVEKALGLMIDDLRFTIDRSAATSQIVNRQSEIVNQVGGDLRKFLEKDFFTKWHLKWYRKRPVYWPLQSAKRGYGFVLFHERVEKYTLYVLLRDYLDHKLNGLHLQIEDLLALAAGQSGAARRQTERQLERARQLLDEVNVFAQTIDRIAKGGYQPEANWIDDGVILRLAPLWELIPIWKAEPKKYWERLEQGDYDWSHIAMAYWPARVRAACRTNKSFAIAHGLIDD